MELKMLTGAFSHDLMITVLEELYPDLKHGRDYIVAHSVDPKDYTVHSDPYFMRWNVEGQTMPDAAEIKAAFFANEAKYRAAFARKFRNACLDGTDGKGNVTDAPAGSKAASMTDQWRAYRQALRDVPQQPGFPMVIDWPISPDQQEGAQ